MVNEGFAPIIVAMPGRQASNSINVQSQAPGVVRRSYRAEPGVVGGLHHADNRLKITRIDADTWTIENGVTVNAILCKSPGGKRKGKPTGKTEAWSGAVPFSLTASVKNPQ